MAKTIVIPENCEELAKYTSQFTIVKPEIITVDTVIRGKQTIVNVPVGTAKEFDNNAPSFLKEEVRKFQQEIGCPHWGVCIHLYDQMLTSAADAIFEEYSNW